MSTPSRRQFLSAAALAAAAASAPAQNSAAAATSPARRKARIGVSTYSFFQFRYMEYRSIESCIDLAAKLGFDGVEILRRQVGEPTAQQMREYKRRAFANGLHLMG